MVRPGWLVIALFPVACASTPASRAPAGGPAAAPGLASSPLVLSPCAVPDLERPARCGTAQVYENPATLRGRTVALKVVVVPAREPPALPDPVVFVAGGPDGRARRALLHQGGKDETGERQP